MNKPITVEELYKSCLEQINKGNGNKHVLIIDDDEGNGYHGCWYAIDDNIDIIKECAEYGMFHDNNNPNDVVLLG